MQNAAIALVAVHMGLAASTGKSWSHEQYYSRGGDVRVLHLANGAHGIGRESRKMPPAQAPEKVAVAIVVLATRPRRTRYVPRLARQGGGRMLTDPSRETRPPQLSTLTFVARLTIGFEYHRHSAKHRRNGLRRRERKRYRDRGARIGRVGVTLGRNTITQGPAGKPSAPVKPLRSDQSASSRFRSRPPNLR